MMSTKALERAHYLGEKLKEQCWNQFGPAGKSLGDWLISTLEFLNPYPPPKGAYIHLYLDLYKREANQVAADVVGLGGERLRSFIPNLSQNILRSKRMKMTRSS
jgi:hypothetical protein